MLKLEHLDPRVMFCVLTPFSRWGFFCLDLMSAQTRARNTRVAGGYAPASGHLQIMTGKGALFARGRIKTQAMAILRGSLEPSALPSLL